MPLQQDKKIDPSVSGTSMERTKKLLDKMTIEEKTMQLSCIYPMGLIGMDGPIRSQLDAELADGIGHIQD